MEEACQIIAQWLILVKDGDPIQTAICDRTRQCGTRAKDELARGLRPVELARRLPTPNLFTGMQEIHGPLEWISLQDMARATELCVELVQLWGGGSERATTDRPVDEAMHRPTRVAPHRPNSNRQLNKLSPIFQDMARATELCVELVQLWAGVATDRPVGEPHSPADTGSPAQPAG